VYGQLFGKRLQVVQRMLIAFLGILDPQAFLRSRLGGVDCQGQAIDRHERAYLPCQTTVFECLTQGTHDLLLVLLTADRLLHSTEIVGDHLCIWYATLLGIVVTDLDTLTTTAIHYYSNLLWRQLSRCRRHRSAEEKH